MGLDGLIAFWDFEYSEDDLWFSKGTEQKYPIFLKQIGDTMAYSVANWPHQDSLSAIKIDQTGPLGNGVRFNKGYIYGSVPRKYFHGELLDLHGRTPFTMVAWIKFIGQRHLVAGIWDEGGWLKYEGRRQVALFGGLFNQKGVIAHVSSTGAASYPQSEVNGSQYARIRAIDSMPFSNNEWVAMAMTFDPARQLVSAYLNGELSSYLLADPITQDVFPNHVDTLANPLPFRSAIFSPTSFYIKYNGYNFDEDGINEHRLWVDLDSKFLIFEAEGSSEILSSEKFRIKFDVRRNANSLLSTPLVEGVNNGLKFNLRMADEIAVGDSITTSLEKLNNSAWTQIGTKIIKVVAEGAPFTFGRALGLASEEIEHGSQIYFDGVAVYDRVLTEQELKAISFKN